MAHTLYFDAADVRRVVEHALSSKKWSKSYFDTRRRRPRPQMVLVHDEGVYLISNGDPRDIVQGDESFVAYARGLDPTRRDRGEVWDEAREAVGGDDFAEFLDLSPSMIMAIRHPAFRELRIGVEGGSFEVTAVVGLA